MASGYQASAVDLDNLFVARVGTARANVGYQVGGTDLAQRYEQLGAGTAGANVGYKSGGVDLATLFAPIGAVSISAQTLNATIGGTSASCRYWLGSDGNILGNTLGNGNTLVDIGDWITPKSGMTAYQAMATIFTGTLESGTPDVWQDLGVGNIVWANIQSGVGSSSCHIDVSIRRKSDSVVVAGPVRIQMSSTRSS